MNDNPEWNESYYFNLHDHSNGVTVFMRIGNKPNKDEKSIFLHFQGKRVKYAERERADFLKEKARREGM